MSLLSFSLFLLFLSFLVSRLETFLERFLAWKDGELGLKSKNNRYLHLNNNRNNDKAIKSFKFKLCQLSFLIHKALRNRVFNLKFIEALARVH